MRQASPLGVRLLLPVWYGVLADDYQHPCIAQLLLVLATRPRTVLVLAFVCGVRFCFCRAAQGQGAFFSVHLFILRLSADSCCGWA